MNSFLLKYRYVFLYTIALFIYLGMMNAVNASHDEIFSLRLLGYSWSEMFSIIVNEDGHPPLYYTLLRLWMSGIDYHNVFWARLFSTFWIFALSLLGPFPIKRLFGDKVGFIYAAIVFFMPVSLFTATFVRMYSLATFLITASMIYATLCLRYNQKSDWVKFFVVSLLGMYTHYLATLFIGVIYSILFFRLLLKSPKWTSELKRFFICGFATAFLFAPWLFVFFNQASSMYDDWYPSIDTISYAFQYFITPILAYLNPPLLLIVNILMVLQYLLLTYFFVHMLISQKTKKQPDLYFFFLIGLLTFSLCLSISYFIRPMLTHMYVNLFIPILYPMIAYFIAQKKRLGIIFIILSISVFIISYNIRTTKLFSPTYTQLSQHIRTTVPTDSTIICVNANACMFLIFYTPEYKRLYLPGVRQLIVLRDLFYRNAQQYAQDINQHPIFSLSMFEDCPKPFKDNYYVSDNYCLLPHTPEQMPLFFQHFELTEDGRFRFIKKP